MFCLGKERFVHRERGSLKYRTSEMREEAVLVAQQSGEYGEGRTCTGRCPGERTDQRRGTADVPGGNPRGPNPVSWSARWRAQLARVCKGIKTGRNSYFCKTEGHQGRSCK